MLNKMFKKRNKACSEIKEFKLQSPIKGESILLVDVPDPMFAGEMLGKGFAVKPTEGILYAPCDGTINMVYDTKHALGMTAQNGAEILMHVGMDTVELQGEFFEVLVKKGETVKVGNPLLKFDISGINGKGYETITPVIITNTEDYDEIVVLYQGVVDIQTEVLLVK